MAEEKFQYTLELSTRATGDGGRKTAEAMRQVAAATNEAAAASQRHAAAAEEQAREMARIAAQMDADARRPEWASAIREQMELLGQLSTARRADGEAEKVRRSEEWKTQADLDVIEAKRRVSARSVTMGTGDPKNFGNVTTQLGYQVNDFAVQVQGGTSALTAFAQQAPQALGAMQGIGAGAGGMAALFASAVNPITFIIMLLTELGVLVPQVIKGWGEMWKAIKNADNAAVNFGANLLTLRDHRIAAAKAFRDDIAKQMEKDAAAAKKFNDELARKDKLARSEDSLAATQTKAGGASSGEVAVQSLGFEASQLTRDIAVAAAKVAQARGAVRDQNAIVETSKLEGLSIADFEAAQKQLQTYQAELETAVADLANLQSVSANKIAEAGITATQTVTDAAQAAQTKVADDVKAKIDTMAAEQGGALSAAAASARERIDKILADGVVAANETAELAGAILQLKQSTEAGTQAMQRGLADLLGISQSNVSQMGSLQNQINALKGQIQQR